MTYNVFSGTLNPTQCSKVECVVCCVGSRLGTCSYIAADGSGVQSSGSAVASARAIVFEALCVELSLSLPSVSNVSSAFFHRNQFCVRED